MQMSSRSVNRRSLLLLLKSGTLAPERRTKTPGESGQRFIQILHFRTAEENASWLQSAPSAKRPSILVSNSGIFFPGSLNWGFFFEWDSEPLAKARHRDICFLGAINSLSCDLA